MSRNLNVVVGIPSADLWSAEFGMSLVSMFVNFLGNQVPGYDSHDGRIYSDRGSVLPLLRQNIVEKALKAEASHLLFLDTDQIFPPDTLNRLASHHKDVVACNVATKSVPAGSTARQKSSHNPKGIPIYTREDSRGLEPVWRVGTGVMLIKLSVFANMPKPWFPIDWTENGEFCIGEDWGFCKNLEKLGIPIYVDHELSWQVSHVGKFRYQHKHVLLPLVDQASAQEMERLKKASPLAALVI